MKNAVPILYGKYLDRKITILFHNLRHIFLHLEALLTFKNYSICCTDSLKSLLVKSWWYIQNIQSFLLQTSHPVHFLSNWCWNDFIWGIFSDVFLRQPHRKRRFNQTKLNREAGLSNIWKVLEVSLQKCIKISIFMNHFFFLQKNFCHSLKWFPSKITIV